MPVINIFKRLVSCLRCYFLLVIASKDFESILLKIYLKFAGPINNSTSLEHCVNTSETVIGTLCSRIILDVFVCRTVQIKNQLKENVHQMIGFTSSASLSDSNSPRRAVAVAWYICKLVNYCFINLQGVLDQSNSQNARAQKSYPK